MKRFFAVTFLFLFLTGSAFALPAFALDEKDLLLAPLKLAKELHESVADHFGVSDSIVAKAVQKSIPDDELAVLFHIARETALSPDAVIKLRLGGSTLMEITFRSGLTAETYYVPVAGPVGPPYGKAYGYYKNKPRNKWREIRLTDTEVVEMMSLKFISAYHGIAPAEVIKMRGKGGQGLKELNRAAKGKGGGKGKGGKGKGGDKGGKGKGKGKGR